MKTMNFTFMSIIALVLTGCANPQTAGKTISHVRSAIPEPVNFIPDTSYLDNGMVTSTVQGLAPSSMSGAVWDFTCTKAKDANEEVPENNTQQFDLSIAFTSDKIVSKTTKCFYYKTGADTATIIYWYAHEDSGTVFGDSMYEIRLTFTDSGSGYAQFATCGHGFDYYGCGVFTLQR